MATSFSIAGVQFEPLDMSDGRKALSCVISNAIQDVRRFHPPGTDGNLLIFNGTTGQRITAHVRYVGQIDTILSWYNDDTLAFEEAVTVVDEAGDVFTRCVMIDMNRVTRPQATGRTPGQAYFDAVISLICESGD